MPSVRRLVPVLWEKSGGTCALCGLPMDPKRLDVDHIIPTSAGGTDDPDNLHVVHHVCNIRKGNRPLDEAIYRIRTTPVVTANHRGRSLVNVHLSSELLERVVDWQFTNRFGSRAAAVKHLLRAGLDLVDRGQGPILPRANEP